MSRQHRFEDQEFSNFTKCFVCDELIAQEVVDGIVNNVPTSLKDFVPTFISQQISQQLPSDKGCTCSKCGLNVHKKCQGLVDIKCATVAHRFEIRSYTPLSTMCAACGTHLQGLYRQGYRCTLCGIDVHPGCRANPLIHDCAALQDQNGQDKPQSVFDEEIEETDLFIDIDEDDPSLPSNKRRKRKQKRAVSLRIEHIVVPASLGGIGKELMKMHTQSRALAVVAEEKWATQDRPKLLQSRKSLQKYNKKLSKAYKARGSKMKKLAAARKLYYKKVLKKLKINEEERENLLDVYSGLMGDEVTMLELLQAQVSGKAELKVLEKEIKTGLHVKAELEKAIEAFDEIRKEQASVSASLEAVRRELFFPKYNHWFARVAVEGKYAAIGTLWLEKLKGALAIRVVMIEKPKTGKLTPTVVIAVCGTETPVNISEMGMPKTKEHKRHKKGTKGAFFTARVESLSVSERNLGVSFILDEVKLDLEIFLNMELEFHSNKKNPSKGKWNLKSNLLKFEKFDLTFKAGALSLPDSVLQYVIRNILTSGIKQAIRSALSPELGNYMLAQHKYRKTMSKDSTPDMEQFRFYAKADITAELPLDGLMFDVSQIRSTKKRKADAKARYTQSLEAVVQALGLNEDQLELLIRTQEEIGLTISNAFPDESLRALGLKAIQNLNVQGALESNDASALNMQGILDAVNKIGLKVISGELISESPPLLSILSLVQYVRTYFGETVDKPTAGDVFAPRIAALWQGALDTVAKNMAKGSFRSRILRGGSSRDVAGGGLGIKIDFLKLIKRIRSINGKRLHTHLEVMDLDIKVGMRGLLDVAEAKALQANLKTKAGGALLFELRNTQVDEEEEEEDELEKLSSVVRGLTKLEYEDSVEEGEESGDDEFKLISTSTKNTSQVSFSDSIGNDFDDFVLVSSLGKGGLQNATRAKAEGIRKEFGEAHARLDYLYEMLFNALQLQLHGFVGSGKYDIELAEVKARIDDQFRKKYSSSILGYSRKDNSWPWRRLVRSTNDGIEAVVVRVTDRADGSTPEKTVSPDQDTNLHFSSAKMDGVLVPHESQSPVKISLSPDPAGRDANESSWQDPGSLNVDVSAPKMSFQGKIPLVRFFGGLENFHDYAADILKWKQDSANVEDNVQRGSQMVLRKLMKYAQLNTFEGSLSCNLEVESNADEVHIRASKSLNFPDEQLLTLDVENDFVQFTDDVAHILKQFRVDPLDRSD